MQAYARDLAYIHDTGFTAFVRKAAPGLLRLLRRYGIHSGLVVDAGCGRLTSIPVPASNVIVRGIGAAGNVSAGGGAVIGWAPWSVRTSTCA